jgi:hypothetical protein
MLVNKVELNQMAKEKEDLNDVFKEAAKMVSNKTIKKEVNEIVDKKLQHQQAMNLTVENAETSWSKLKGKVNAEYADKAMQIMETLPDREYLRMYFKMLEFVNPKVVRKEVLEGEEDDMNIKVVIYQQNNNYENGEEKIIDVTE